MPTLEEVFRSLVQEDDLEARAEQIAAAVSGA
jgi:hypothetical protein